MTASTYSLPFEHGASPAAPEGALVRMATGDRWLAGLHSAPARGQVTVSLSSRAAVQRYAEGLTRQGYRVVGVPVEPASVLPYGAGAHADFLVSPLLLEKERRWWRAFAAHADAVFNLGHGPVQLALTEVLQAHLADRR